MGKDLDFEVKSLVVNGNGRMVAVVGDTQVSVVILPKSGSVGLTGGNLTVKWVTHLYSVQPLRYLEHG